ncbi:MAG: Rrf2 family transcriptional regulator [Rickettsiales bacterium]
MMLTTKGRYSVMAMVDIAFYSADSLDKAIALHEISKRQEIPIGYLEQLFIKLRKMNLVISVKGPGGGYKLARQAKDITVLEIIDAVGESLKITRCNNTDGKGCLITQKKICFTHTLWDGLGKQIKGYLDSVTLEDICNKV